MMAKKPTHTPVRQNVFGATLARFVGKRRSRARPRLSSLRKMPLLHRFAPRKLIRSPDPVSLDPDCGGLNAGSAGPPMRGLAAPDIAA